MGAQYSVLSTPNNDKIPSGLLHAIDTKTLRAPKIFISHQKKENLCTSKVPRSFPSVPFFNCKFLGFFHANQLCCTVPLLLQSLCDYTVSSTYNDKISYAHLLISNFSKKSMSCEGLSGSRQLTTASLTLLKTH